ncbi:MAG TPA: trypco2 family protein [Streptosporangiaceae bacterium]|jgi:hypothetical protein
MIELARLIKDLRHELDDATAAAKGQALRLELGPIDLELALRVDSDVQAGAKVRFWVVEVGADGSVGSGSTTKVRLRLNPRLADSADAPYVSGQEVDGER